METEEEQIEKLKAWLKENGMSIVLGVVIGLGGLFGYRYWIQMQETAAEEASNHFTQIVEGLAAGDQARVQEHAEALIDGYADTDYALLARLALARNHVDSGEFEQAESQLQQVVDGAAEQPVGYVARARLARVQLQRQRYDEALATLSTGFPPEFAAQVEELRGDIYARQGKVDAAIEAYRKARTAEPGPANREFLQQKLHDLGSTG